MNAFPNNHFVWKATEANTFSGVHNLLMPWTSTEHLMQWPGGTMRTSLNVFFLQLGGMGGKKTEIKIRWIVCILLSSFKYENNSSKIFLIGYVFNIIQRYSKGLVSSTSIGQ